MFLCLFAYDRFGFLTNCHKMWTFFPRTPLFLFTFIFGHASVPFPMRMPNRFTLRHCVALRIQGATRGTFFPPAPFLRADLWGARCLQQLQLQCLAPRSSRDAWVWICRGNTFKHFILFFFFNSKQGEICSTLWTPLMLPAGCAPLTPSAQRSGPASLWHPGLHRGFWALRARAHPKETWRYWAPSISSSRTYNYTSSIITELALGKKKIQQSQSGSIYDICW